LLEQLAHDADLATRGAADAAARALTGLAERN
jgi:hypothetical protein